MTKAEDYRNATNIIHYIIDIVSVICWYTAFRSPKLTVFDSDGERGQSIAQRGAECGRGDYRCYG
jgi:hypothetical protein